MNSSVFDLFYGKNGSRGTVIKKVEDAIKIKKICLLEGPCGIGKSKIIKELIASGDVFTRNITTIDSKDKLSQFLLKYSFEIINEGIKDQTIIAQKILLHRNLEDLIKGDNIKIEDQIRLFQNFLNGIKTVVPKIIHLENDWDGNVFSVVKDLSKINGILILLERNYLGVKMAQDHATRFAKIIEIPSFSSKTAQDFINGEHSALNNDQRYEKSLLNESEAKQIFQCKNKFPELIINEIGYHPELLYSVCTNLNEKIKTGTNATDRISFFEQNVDFTDLSFLVEGVLTYLKNRHKIGYSDLHKLIIKGSSSTPTEINEQKICIDLGLLVKNKNDAYEIPSVFKMIIKREIKEEISSISHSLNELYDRREYFEKNALKKNLESKGYFSFQQEQKDSAKEESIIREIKYKEGRLQELGGKLGGSDD